MAVLRCRIAAATMAAGISPMTSCAAAQALGLELRVESVNVRPGKPTFFGVLGDGRRLLGLPGNPASAFVCAEMFLKPILSAYQGAAMFITTVNNMMGTLLAMIH